MTPQELLRARIAMLEELEDRAMPLVTDSIEGREHEMDRIIFRVEGGMVQSVEGIPPGVIVEVRDYDTDGLDDEELETDDDGIPHRIADEYGSDD